MNIDQWITQILQAYQLSGKNFSQEKKAFLLSELSENISPGQKQILAEAYDVITRIFYSKASRGETFGSLSRINENFGRTLEDNYGLTSGPFLGMAKAYWTFKIEVQDLFPEYHKYVLSQILLRVETDVSSVFFPTPGIMMPVSLRRTTQRQLLKEYAPNMDIERFFSESPVLKVSAGKSGCLGIALVLVSIPAGALVVFGSLFI